MRALLSTIGSRGDVQPLVALALELRSAGAQVRLCVPPDFREWIDGLGFDVVPIGPELRSTGKADRPRPVPTPEQRRQMIEGTVAAQFETIGEAARGCDIIVGATALQIAAPSIAERLNVPYVFAAFCPAVLPSPAHAPPVLRMIGDVPPTERSDYSEFWAKDAKRWNDSWAEALNSRRAMLGLAPVPDVRSYVLTHEPWLAADPVLAPWPGSSDSQVFQTGAWTVEDDRPLSTEIERFLNAGDAPVYLGFGSVSAPTNLSEGLIAAARAVSRRVIVSRGWADLSLVDDASDCLAIGEVNQQALFPHVAAVVHHGGAGTTTAAARSGAPQVVIPQHYDQHYWAQRVGDLGIGVALGPSVPTVESLTRALADALTPAVTQRAREISQTIRSDGARIAARRLLEISQTR